ncbi:ornithine cyclodeaminase family protein [Cohaesibacter gelatinilyticus]|uniref:Ornithine cyclodeaminase n=1 Tax=Cohaesibacter gelatinilyticus TaxID=372072 RepID=A0A285PFR5_9HYPH|nr:ornithine cyclodeaminase family protein [Cohaesibacter gelatinilyticus]SNZ20560.1 ornithine cyclodeaminase [Cohaesibacter gelatinilyticus]
MQIIGKEQILDHVDLPAVLNDIENGFKAFASGKAQVAPVTHLGFDTSNGECHIKCAHVDGDEVFTVKLATGFYDNPAKGMSSSNGFMAVISAEHGTPLAILQDEGVLTDLRTALAGVLATRLGARSSAKTIGILGSGIQGHLQAKLICELLGYKSVVIWGRDDEKTASLIEVLRSELPDVDVAQAETPSELCEKADVIVTTTPSKAPLIEAEWVRPGTHIVAVGADSPGKQEIDEQLFARASQIFVDSPSQCIEHGETTNALQAKVIAESDLTPLGEALLNGAKPRSDDDITIADLTGVAVQDAAIAKSVWLNMEQRSK